MWDLGCQWSFAGLFATALMQAVVVVLSGSVALLSDTIHTSATRLPPSRCGSHSPSLARMGASRRFTFGYGRVENMAGVVVVLIILFSAVVAGYQAIDRIFNPRPVEFLELWRWPQ